jgi:hypothetical protein
MSDAGICILIALFATGGISVALWLVAPDVGRGARCAFELSRRAAAFVYRGTSLRTGLARLWIAVSVLWALHALWWIFTHCKSAWFGYDCSISGSRAATFDTLDLAGYLLDDTPMHAADRTGDLLGHSGISDKAT